MAERPSSRIRISLGAFCLALLSAALAGCTNVHDSAEARLCRSLLPALNAPTARIAILQTSAENPRGLTGRSVMIRYRSVVEQSERDRFLSCVFARQPSGPTPTLLALATEQGLVGNVRLHLLQRHWIGRGYWSSSDPEPLTMINSAPQLPRSIAIPLQQVLTGLPTTALYALLATAFALIYGLIGRIALVFGELAIVASVSGFLAYRLAEPSDNVALSLGAFMLAGLMFGTTVGALFATVVLKPLARRPGQQILIVSVALAIAGLEALRLLQGTGTKWLSPIGARPIGIARADGFIITIHPTAISVAITAFAASALVLLTLHWTRAGRLWRATADDPATAAMFGVSPQRVLTLATITACNLAALSGSLAMLHFGSAGQGQALTMGLKALTAAIIGGIGSVPGAFAGGLLIGFGEALWASAFPIEFRDAALYCTLALVLAVKPSGLFVSAAKHTSTSLESSRL